MAPMSSTEPDLAPYYPLLLRLARHSIDYGMKQGARPAVNTGSHDPPLRHRRASFVTLNHNHQLRGCIGSLQARQPLAENIVANAYSAAFCDPRFPRLDPSEIENLSLHVSVLSPPAELGCETEAELLAMIRPGKDGLILQDGEYRATFLPAVWKSIPAAEEFIARLKLKAGMNASHWSATTRAFRYTAEEFGADYHSISPDPGDRYADE